MKRKVTKTISGNQDICVFSPFERIAEVQDDVLESYSERGWRPKKSSK